jgi:hypothetical protein
MAPIFSAQRGWNGHPRGRENGCGMDPLIVARRDRGSASTLGIERNSERV